MSTMKNLASLRLLLAVIAVVVMTAQTVDIQSFDSSAGCSGTGYTFSNVSAQVCVEFPTMEGAVQFSNFSSCINATLYQGANCTNLTANLQSNTKICIFNSSNGDFESAAWFNSCSSRRKLLATAIGCTSHAAPTGVHYTDSEGSWILPTPNTAFVLERLRAVGDAAKAEWLKAQHAHFIKG